MCFPAIRKYCFVGYARGQCITVWTSDDRLDVICFKCMEGASESKKRALICWRCQCFCQAERLAPTFKRRECSLLTTSTNHPQASNQNDPSYVARHRLALHSLFLFSAIIGDESCSSDEGNTSTAAVPNEAISSASLDQANTFGVSRLNGLHFACTHPPSKVFFPCVESRRGRTTAGQMPVPLEHRLGLQLPTDWSLPTE